MLERSRWKCVVGKIGREDLVYSVLDWYARISIANNKQIIFTEMKTGRNQREFVAEEVLRTILKENSTLRDTIVSTPDTLSDGGDEQHPAGQIRTPQIRITAKGALIFAQLLQGTIEHIQHLRDLRKESGENGATKKNYTDDQAHAMVVISLFEVRGMVISDKYGFWKNGSDGFY